MKYSFVILVDRAASHVTNNLMKYLDQFIYIILFRSVYLHNLQLRILRILKHKH